MYLDVVKVGVDTLQQQNEVGGGTGGCPGYIEGELTDGTVELLSFIGYMLDEPSVDT